MIKDQRPDPDQLLKIAQAEANSRQRGQLKIFFGAAAGVGKTYAMLQAAHALIKEGIDVVIGVVETHNRAETMQLVQNLPHLPLREISHKNITLQELDLDAALQRKPDVLLVDELAHTNAPGSRHPKRWQDVEELLQAGINVYTTINVQHLESLNDVVAGITGIAVRETVPDAVFDTADDVKLVDISTDELLERLHDGKVYTAVEAKDRAAQNFFNKTNLMSLRELALRRTADHVDADTDYERSREGVFTANMAGDRILVCIGSDNLSTKLVRTGRRMAKSLKAPWYALVINTPSQRHNSRLYRHQQQAIQIAEQNGAHIVTLQEERIGDAILDFARQKGITKIIIGRAIRPKWRDFLRRSLVEHIIRHSGAIDVYVMTGRKDISEKDKQERSKVFHWKSYTLATFVTIVCTALSIVFNRFLEPIDIVMIYLIGVVVAAPVIGRLPALFLSLLCVSAFNFFFVAPIYSFNVYDGSYLLTFIVMLGTSLIISSQANRLRHQTIMSRQQERETQIFYTLTKELAASYDRDKVITAAYRHINEALDGSIVIWLPQDIDRLFPTEGYVIGNPLKEETVAKWAYDHNQPSGYGTDTLPSAQAYYYPLKGTHQVLGVLSVTPQQLNINLPNEQKTIIMTFANLVATALERVTATSQVEQSRLDTETERLRNTFLSSMSHDLRSPLSAITGAAETLVNPGAHLADSTKTDLLYSIAKEASRLSRVVNNLLDLSRFETKFPPMNAHAYYPQELIGATLDSLRPFLNGHIIQMDIPDELPMITVDGLLFQQVLQNLIENAHSFSPKDQPIKIIVREEIDGLHFIVADKGPGVPSGKEKQIFDKFFTFSQGDRHKGTGLGLAICDTIVKAHNGTIWAENPVSGGAAFHVLLPRSVFAPVLVGTDEPV